MRFARPSETRRRLPPIVKIDDICGGTLRHADTEARQRDCPITILLIPGVIAERVRWFSFILKSSVNDRPTKCEYPRARYVTPGVTNQTVTSRDLPVQDGDRLKYKKYVKEISTYGDFPLTFRDTQAANSQLR